MHVWFSREVTKITASAKEAPVNSRVQRVSYRHELFLDFTLTVKAATLMFISGCGSAISSAEEGKSGFT